MNQEGFVARCRVGPKKLARWNREALAAGVVDFGFFVAMVRGGSEHWALVWDSLGRVYNYHPATRQLAGRVE